RLRRLVRRLFAAADRRGGQRRREVPGVPRLGRPPLGGGAEPRQPGLRGLAHGHLVQPGSAGDGGAGAGQAGAGDLDRRLQLRGWVAVLGAGRVARAGGLKGRARDRATVVAALQRRRGAGGALGPGPVVFVRAGVPPGVAPASQPRASAGRVRPPALAAGPFRPLFAVAVLLGAPLPLHPLRRVTNQAPQRADQPVLLRRRSRRVDLGRVPVVERPVVARWLTRRRPGGGQCPGTEDRNATGTPSMTTAWCCVIRATRKRLTGPRWKGSPRTTAPR